MPSEPATVGFSPSMMDSREVALIEEIPLEVLYHIFSLSVNESMDVGLFLTSKPMAQKLAGHPTIRAMQKFLTADELLILYPEGGRVRKGASKAAMDLLGRERGGNEGSRDEKLLSTFWCNDDFIQRSQLAVIKRMLATYWDPLLARDGHAPSQISQAYLWRELEVAMSSETPPATDVKLVSQAGPIEGRWKWTTVIIWPSSGRIAVRDQLYNRWTEICCPMLRTFLALKQMQTVV